MKATVLPHSEDDQAVTGGVHLPGHTAVSSEGWYHRQKIEDSATVITRRLSNPGATPSSSGQGLRGVGPLASSGQGLRGDGE